MATTVQPTTTTQKVVGLSDVFRRYFRPRRNHVVSGRVDKPRNRGRWALGYAMAEMGFRTGVEVGVMYGDSAEMWCQTNPYLHLTCVDPFGKYTKLGRRHSQEATFEGTSARLAPYNVTMLKKKSLEAVDSFPDASLDFVHIDADHSFDMCVVDLIVWVPKVRPGGLILVHDYASLTWHGVTEAVNAYLFAHGIRDWWATFDVSPTVFWQRGAS